MDSKEEQQQIPSYGCLMLKQLCAQNLCLIHDSLMLQVFRNLFNGASLHVVFIFFIPFDGLLSHNIQLLGTSNCSAEVLREDLYDDPKIKQIE